MELILYPLTWLYDWFFQHFYSTTSSYGLAIILLSIFVSTIMLPLFWIGDHILNRGAEQKQKMQAELDSLKDVPVALKRYYYTREIYRIYGYHPLQPLSNLLGLLIQIPFFLAAYFYLSHYEAFAGVTFGPFSDLSKPDGLLGGINLMPLLMTLVNLASALIYLKNSTKSQQIQFYVLAGAFLILLYNSPVALLLYWTCNNLYSLIKNIIVSDFKLRELKTIAQSGLKICGIKLYKLLVSNSNFLAIAITVFFLIISRKFHSRVDAQLPEYFHSKLLFLLLDLMLFLSVLKYWSHFYYYRTVAVSKLKFIRWLFGASICFAVAGLAIFHLNHVLQILNFQLQLFPNVIRLKIAIILQIYTLFSMIVLSYIRIKSFIPNFALQQSQPKNRGRLFRLSNINIVLLSFLAIFYSPLLAIASAPREFPHLMPLLLQLLLIVIALFLLLVLCKKVIKKQFHSTYDYLLFTATVYFLINYYVFNTNNYGLMDRFILPSIRVLEITKSKILLDIVTLYLTCFLFFRYRSYINKYAAKISGIVFLILFISSIQPLMKIINYTDDGNENNLSYTESEINSDIPEKFFQFSKNGKNVLVVFFDRFIGGLVPDILQDVPELNEKLSGFTWYPNTVSSGTQTITGLPAIYGGYPFTLGSVNAPSANTFMPRNDKWNKTDSESSKRIGKSTYFIINKFLDAGWHTFINDPSYLSGKFYGDPELVASWGANSRAANFIEGGYVAPAFSKYTKISNNIEIEGSSNTELLKQIILPYSLFKIAPPSLRLKIYNKGKWNSIDSQRWIRHYLQNLALARMYPYLSEAMDDQNSYYNFTTNVMTHDVYAARDNGKFVKYNKQANDWQRVQEGGISKESLQRFTDEHTAVHFFADKEALVQMAKWIDWLKQNAVYDNTMIIIVSDHGWGGIANPMFEQQTSADGIDYSAYNALLMVKGFNQRGSLQTEHEFMSIADVPSFVLQSIEPNAAAKYSIDKSSGLRLYAPKKGSKFLVVKDDISKPENWFYQ